MLELCSEINLSVKSFTVRWLFKYENIALRKKVNERGLLDMRCFCTPCVGVAEQYLYGTIMSGSDDRS